MPEKSEKQKLVDACFEIGLMISESQYKFHEKSVEKRAEWIAKQLKGVGFDTKPIGCSWGVLKDGS